MRIFPKTGEPKLARDLYKLLSCRDQLRSAHVNTLNIVETKSAQLERLRREGHANFVGARCCAKSDIESIPAVNGYDG